MLTLISADPRFTNIQTDPRFQLPSKKTTHVEIDKRFARMLRDEEFSSRARVDRYGRKLPKDAGKKELERYYRLEDEGHMEEVELELERANARDAEISDTLSESSSDEDDSEEVEDDEVFGFPDDQGVDGEEVPRGEPSSRLAVVNLDWDNIKSSDLMAVFSSFTPGDGRVLKISVYPSEFGKERMEREETEGPPREIFAQRKPGTEINHINAESRTDEESSDDAEGDEEIKKSIIKEDDGREFNSAKLRRYQLERLRYYYAVLTCSSTFVAQAIYDAVDGTEYLTSANFFDLRFIPDEVEFSNEKPRDECERIPDSYRPNEFVTDALQHSKVRLTWDADDGSRKEAQKRAFAGSRADINENDLKAYLGSESSGDDELEPFVVDATTEIKNGKADEDVEEPNPPQLSKKEMERQRMRALLGLEKEASANKRSKSAASAPVGDMQVTFSSGLSSEPARTSVFENEPPRDETTVEKYVRREKERKSRRKEKLKNMRNNTNTPGDQAPATTANPTANSTTEDLGFSDPFFTSLISSKRPPKAARSKTHSNPDDDLIVKATTAPSAAELSLLMLPKNPPTADATIQHFNMQEIALAERALAKRAKTRHRARLSKREQAALVTHQNEGGKDTFEVDVGDPRFGAVFEKSEFAIDPTHPRFSGTGGMRKLLEEARRKRGKVDGEQDWEWGEQKGRVREGKRMDDRGGKRRVERDGGEEGLEGLTARVQKKTKLVEQCTEG